MTTEGGDAVTVQVLNSHYEYAPTAFNYRVIAGTSLDFYDDGSAEVVLPFVIGFGGGSFDRIAEWVTMYRLADSPPRSDVPGGSWSIHRRRLGNAHTDVRPPEPRWRTS